MCRPEEASRTLRSSIGIDDKVTKSAIEATGARSQGEAVEFDRRTLVHIADTTVEFRALALGLASVRAPATAGRTIRPWCVWQAEIIGEAVERVSPAMTASAHDVPWRPIAGTRNRLIHGYFQVDLEAVRTMATDDLPPLRLRVLGLLDRR